MYACIVACVCGVVCMFVCVYLNDLLLYMMKFTSIRLRCPYVHINMIVCVRMRISVCTCV